MRLLIVEDEADLATALARGLRRSGYAVDIAADGLRGWELAETNEYDLLVLDLNLPGMDGMDLAACVRRSRPHLAILVLTARSGVDDRVSGLDAGVDDYLVKPFHFEELAARVRALLRRGLPTREPVLRVGNLALDPAALRAWQGEVEILLTPKEFGILAYLMARPGAVVSQEELLEHVWDAFADPFTHTVRVHVSSLRRKLHDDADRPVHIETVIGRGYRLLPAGPAR